MAKVVSVVGARPNFVKLAALHPAIARRFDHVIIHTGQHYDYEMSKIFFEHLEVPEPDYYLGVGSGTHGYQVGEAVRRTEEVLFRERPNIVVVYGDTNSALAGALAAVKAGFPVAHVEAGLRSFDMSMPEEVNRRVIDHVSSLLFAPTETAVWNLRRESVMGEIHLTGDVHVDVLMRWVDVAEERSTIMDKLGVEDKNYVLVTVHRAENVDNPHNLGRIVEVIREVPERYGRNVVFPVHPRTLTALRSFSLLERLGDPRIALIGPLGYVDFIKLLRHAWRVITDSGGVQREAYLLGVPCIVIRDRTEWVDLVESGYVTLTGLDPRKVLAALETDAPREGPRDLLGRGNASEKIAEILVNRLDV